MTPPDSSVPQLDRRQAIQWMLAAGASLGLREAAESAAPVRAQGYGPDPSMVRIYQPGDVWPLTLSPPPRRTAAALCDVMIPADEASPSASAVGVTDFIDEWISSPYPGQAADRRLVLDGLAWIEQEAQRRFLAGFADLREDQQCAICDDLCDPAQARPEHKSAARFFKRYRDLTAGGYYTTPEGMRDIGYRGNVSLAAFDGPPVEALRHVGLA